MAHQIRYEGKLKAVFLDRDGVINEDRDDYVKGINELKIFHYVPKSILRLNQAGYEVFVISNQQAIAKNIISEADLQAMQDEISSKVSKAGGTIAKFYYCKHLATDGCSCRKPKPGLLQIAAKENGIELSETFMIGDAERDIIAGKAAGCRTILVLSGKLSRKEADDLTSKPDYIAQNLAEALDWLLANSPTSST